MRHLSIVFLAFALCCCRTTSADDAPNSEAFERKVLYHPRPYEQADIDHFKAQGGQSVDYKTDQGNQTAWLIAPADHAEPDHIWIVCGGNATLALELAPFVRDLQFKSDAFLIVDYPGYGSCAGKPDPKSIRQSMKIATETVGKKFDLDPAKNPGKFFVLGHSLGCAACLMVVEDFHLKTAVLCAPFTSSHEMAELRFGLAKSAPMINQFDNRVGLKELKKNNGHAWIIHGLDDEVIPVDMSKTLASEFDGVVKLTTVKDAGHNDLLDIAKTQIIEAMTAAEK